jgi:hypothetical protein
MSDEKREQRIRDEALSRIDAKLSDSSSKRKFLPLQEKILRISKAAGQIPRNGQDPETGKMYARLEDVLGVIKPLMERYKLILAPTCEQSSVSNGTRHEVVRWRLWDVTADALEFLIPGSGLDNEGHGTALALSASRKAALVLIFNLRVADEPLISTDDAQTQADKIAASKIAAAQKRKETEELKECVRISQLENGNYLVRGRIHIMEHPGAFAAVQEASIGETYSALNAGWLINGSHVENIAKLAQRLKACGCKIEWV